MKGTSACQRGLRGKPGQHRVDSPALFSKDALEVVLINTACLHLPKLFIMGCMKSKETFPFPTTLDIDKLHESEEAFIPDDSSQYRTPSPGEQQQVQEVKKLPEPGAVFGALILNSQTVWPVKLWRMPCSSGHVKTSSTTTSHTSRVRAQTPPLIDDTQLCSGCSRC